MPGPLVLDKGREKERFRRWAKQLGIEFNESAFDDLVAFFGLKAVVQDFEAAFVHVQQGKEWSERLGGGA